MNFNPSPMNVFTTIILTLVLFLLLIRPLNVRHFRGILESLVLVIVLVFVCPAPVDIREQRCEC